VVITGRDQTKLHETGRQLGVEVASNTEAVKGADAILLSVPIDGFEQVIKEISPHLHSGQVIADITSIKVFPVDVMHRHIKTGTVLGAHPMFGPGATTIVNQNFVLTPTNEDERAPARKIKDYLENRGARVVLMSPHEHDELMTAVLGLSHFIAIVTADTLSRFDNLELMRAVSGSSYRVLLTLVESVISEDPEFYASLQMSLPNITEIERLFQGSSKIWADLIANRDRQEFVREMNALRNKLEISDRNFGKGYRNMYKIVEGL
jgi:prephenate dehydrogenase